MKPEWLEVLQLAFEEGLQDKAIAQVMHKSERMIRHYWSKIQDALEIYPEEGKNMRAMTQIRARETGLIDSIAMSIVLEPQNILKRRVTLAILSLATMSATIATFLHRLQPNPYIVDLIAPPLLAIAFLILLIRLYKKPESLQQVTHLALLGAVMFVVVPSWLFTLEAASSDTTLVGSLPPLTSALFVLTMVMLISLRPQRLAIATMVTWIAIAAPILTYLSLHPVELLTSRGLDLFISLGPAMGIQIVLILFYNRLQDMVDRLYTDGGDLPTLKG